MMMGPRGVESDTLRSSKVDRWTMTPRLDHEMISKVEYDATVVLSGWIGADEVCTRDIDDAVAQRDRPSNADIVLGEMPGLSDGSKIELIVRNKFWDSWKFISEQRNVICCEFERVLNLVPRGISQFYFYLFLRSENPVLSWLKRFHIWSAFSLQGIQACWHLCLYWWNFFVSYDLKSSSIMIAADSMPWNNQFKLWKDVNYYLKRN